MKQKVAHMVLALVFGAAALTVAAEPADSPAAAPSGKESAGPRRSFGHSPRFLKFAEQLDLTAEQKKQVETLRAENSKKIKPLMKRKWELARAVHDGELALMTPKAIDKHSRQVGKVQAQISKARLESMVAFAKILTPEQRKRLKQLHEQRRAKWREKHGLNKQ